MKLVTQNNEPKKGSAPDPEWWKALQNARGFRTSLHHARGLLKAWRARRIAA